MENSANFLIRVYKSGQSFRGLAVDEKKSLPTTTPAKLDLILSLSLFLS